jgi:uncharacterized membrane protein
VDPQGANANRSVELNIQTVAKLEQESLLSRSLGDRIGDTIAGFAGSMRFVALHLIWFALWAVVNKGWAGLPPFDPYPFNFLTMIVSMEGVLIATFVLIKQNRMTRQAEHRDHLNLQIDLLSEKELTKVLQMQRLLCDHFGLKHISEDSEAKELSENTAVEALARDLKEKMPGGG